MAGRRVECTSERSTPDVHFLPVAPEVPGKIFSFFHGDAGATNELADVVSQDPMLAVKLLRAFVSSGARIDRGRLSIRHLVDSLSPFDLRSQLLPEAIRGLFFRSPECFWREYWEHSLFCARLSQHIAMQVSYPAPGEAYLAGLLHNLGAYILMSQDPAKYREVATEAMENQSDILMLEEERFGVSHTQLGGSYADKWGLPGSISQAIKHHHDVDAKVVSPLLHILSVAHNVALQLGVGAEHSLSGARQLRTSLAQLDLDLRKVLDAAARLRLSGDPTALAVSTQCTVGTNSRGL
jgi:HD-like signal output (HDOD) protein